MVIGSFTLSQDLGVLAIFAPSGLGVREGSIALLLNQFLPLGEALLISFLARIWTVLSEIILFLIIYSYSRIINAYNR